MINGLLGSRSKAMGFIHLAFEDIRDKGKWQRKRRETREPYEEQKWSKEGSTERRKECFT